MCGSTIVTSTSSPSRNGIGALVDLVARRPPCMIVEVVERQALGALKWKILPVSASSACSTRAPSPVNCALTRGLHPDEERLGARAARATRSRAGWRSNSIAIVSSDLTTPSPSHVGHGRDMISRTPSVTFWRVISTRPSLEISAVKVFVRSSSSALRSVLSTASRLLGARHVDEVDDDDPADVAQAQLR